MTNALKKVTFPFFNTIRHHFLVEKWWFRLLIVFYAIGAIILLGSVWSEFATSQWGWCYDSLYLYLGNDAEFTQHFNQCKEIWKESFAWVALGAFASIAVIHYVTQFIFFTVIIDFIVLGGKPKKHVSTH